MKSLIKRLLRENLLDEVSGDYGGIEIAPYINKARFEYDWYYGWDVASGCIWNGDAIIGIDKLGISD